MEEYVWYVQAVDKHWTDKILAEAAKKTSLKSMNTQKYSIGQVQLVWCYAGFDIVSVQKRGWKARLMSGTYMLQLTRAEFNQQQVDSTCLLCCKEPVEHFLLRCESLTQLRQPFLDKIDQSLQKSVGVGHVNRIRLNDTTRFNQHQVDPTCLLCCKEPENVEHFLLRYESLTQ